MLPVKKICQFVKNTYCRFLLKEFEADHKNFEYKSKNAYEEDLYEAWNQLKNSQDQVRSAKDSWVFQLKKLEIKESECELLEKDRRERIIEMLKSI